MTRNGLDVADRLEEARSYVRSHALVESDNHRVGLELECHLIDLRHLERRPEWSEIAAIIDGLPAMPAGSNTSVEPGGQLELSTLPMDDAGSAVQALRTDLQALRAAVRESGLALLPLGADPLRVPCRVHPGQRYTAMEQHFTGCGCGTDGTAMMTATAALQINLDAGAAANWAERVRLVSGLCPVLIAVSAASPLLGGRRSGWSSMRQQSWYGIDQRRAGPVRCTDDPAGSWAEYAMAAPVMQVKHPGGRTPITTAYSFGSWVSADAPFGRPPTSADLDDHLTTLFPPVRLRGHLELRSMDALPDRWWPGLVAFAVTLLDDQSAAVSLAEVVEPVRDLWTEAAKFGLSDARLARAARGCAEIARRHVPAQLRTELEEFCALIDRGLTPADLLRRRIEQVGTAAVIKEEADV